MRNEELNTTFDIRNGVVELVSAYVANANTRINGDELQTLIRETFSTLSNLEPGETVVAAAAPEPVALSKSDVRKSITTSALVSFEDNKPYKSLKRHLSSRGMTPAEYRAKWGLPLDYPMVHPAYSAQRSALAKAIGLGAKGRHPKDAASSAATPARKPRKPRSAAAG